VASLLTTLSGGIACAAVKFYPRDRLKGKKQDSSQPDFWSKRYASGRTPWHLDKLQKQLGAFIRQLPLHQSILIPGCGDDFQTIAAFCVAGHDLIAIDFSAVAIELARSGLGPLGDRVIHGDFFHYNLKPAAFDVIYERTFLCSLHPRFWIRYAARVAQLLRPSGTLAGFFFYGTESDPPPYPLTESKAAEIFSGRFKLTRSEAVPDSLAFFAGSEKWQEWELRS
jgi:Thiopurine S-methyltransferase (TPMT)